MKSLTIFFTVASGAFAVIPGLAILVSNVGVPPNSSNALFSAIIEALGVLTLMILWLNKGNIRKRTEVNVTKLAIGGILVFIICLFCYLFLFAYLIEEVPNSNSLFFPLWAQGDLKQNLEIFGSRSELITQFGRDDVAKLIKDTSNTSLILTTIILLAIYQLIFVSLTYAFGMLAVKSTSDEDEKITAPASIDNSEAGG